MKEHRSEISTHRTIRKPNRLASAILYGIAVGIAFLAQPQESRAQGKSFLWKVQSKQNTIYLLGSIHALRPENYPLKPAIEQAYERSKRLVLEIDLGSAAPDKVQALILQKGVYLDGRTLRQSVSEKTFSLLQKQAEEFGLPIQAVERFKPWYAAITLLSLKLNKLGFNQRQGVDWYFFSRAKKDHKEVAGLETLEYQFGLFDEMSIADQEEMLLQTLKEMDLLERELDKLVRGWVGGDVNALDTLLLESFREHPKVEQSLLIERNRQWLPKVEGYLARGEPCLVVVGAAHLIGSGGLVEILKARGYTVEQM
jgi:uncharacterized protein